MKGRSDMNLVFTDSERAAAADELALLGVKQKLGADHRDAEALIAFIARALTFLLFLRPNADSLRILLAMIDIAQTGAFPAAPAPVAALKEPTAELPVLDQRAPLPVAPRPDVTPPRLALEMPDIPDPDDQTLDRVLQGLKALA
jgi:hypothetical protein